MYSNSLYIAESWWFIFNSQTSENVRGLVQVVLQTETNVFFYLLYTHVCSIHRFLSVLQWRCQFSPFFILDKWETMKIFNLSQIHSACVLSTARSLVTSFLLRIFAFAYCRTDFGVKTSGHMFSDVA